MGGRPVGNSGEDSHKNRSQNDRRGTMDNTIASDKIGNNMGKLKLNALFLYFKTFYIDTLNKAYNNRGSLQSSHGNRGEEVINRSSI